MNLILCNIIQNLSCISVKRLDWLEERSPDAKENDKYCHKTAQNHPFILVCTKESSIKARLVTVVFRLAAYRSFM